MNGKGKILLGILVLIIIIGAGVAWFVFNQPLPSDLQKATYVGFDQNGKMEAFQRVNGSLAVVSVPAGFTSIAPARGGYAVITQNGDAFQILLNGHAVVSPTTTPANVAVSPDGRWVGFSLWKIAATSTPSGPVEQSVGMGDPSWVAAIMDLSAKTPTVQSLNLGSSPVFTDAKHVAWLSPRGIAGMDLGSGMETLLVPLKERSSFGPLLVSPDGKHIAVNDLANKTLDIYSVTGTKATLVAQIAHDKQRPATSYTLGTDAIYSVRGTKNDTEIWTMTYAGANPKELISLPNSYHINRIMIPSTL